MNDTAAPHRVPSSGRVGNDMLCQFALKGSTSRGEQWGFLGTHAEEEDQRRRAPVLSN